MNGSANRPNASSFAERVLVEGEEFRTVRFVRRADSRTSWDVLLKTQDHKQGQIQWDTQHARFVLYPVPGSYFHTRMLREITQFVSVVTKIQRATQGITGERRG